MLKCHSVDANSEIKFWKFCGFIDRYEVSLVTHLRADDATIAVVRLKFFFFSVLILLISNAADASMPSDESNFYFMKTWKNFSFRIITERKLKFALSKAHL